MILEDLYCGKIFPAEDIVPKGKNYEEMNQEISQQMKKLEKILDREDFSDIEKLRELLANRSETEFSQSFIYGFRLGALMMTEVFFGNQTE